MGAGRRKSAKLVTRSRNSVIFRVLPLPPPGRKYHGREKKGPPMKTKTGLVIALGFLFTSSLLSAQETPPNALLALSKRDHTLAIIDPATLKVIAKAPV